MSRPLQILEASGLSRTETRINLLGVFLTSDVALSLATIEEMAKDIDRVTLYRNLKTFESKGIIHKAHDATNHPKYALCEEHCGEHHHQDHHPHFHCTSCEKTVCLESVITPQPMNVPKGYMVRETNMILSGICPDCI